MANLIVNKSNLTERDIITKYIIPALAKAGWEHSQIREEVFFTDGRISVHGKTMKRGDRKRADIILFLKPNIPIAIIEAKDNNHSIGSGMQQALNYADILDIPVAFSSNGDGFIMHDRSGYTSPVEKELTLDNFPNLQEIMAMYKKYKGIETPEIEAVSTQDYYYDGSGRQPRYYQQIAINRTVEAIAKGQNRILLVMATGTGKTYVAFQIMHRLWKSKAKKRILFLADRTALINQAARSDMRHFKEPMTIIRKKNIDKAYEIYLSLYQGLTNYDEDIKDAYKEFSPDFFDLVIIDECHRGSAKADSAWREILEYFSSATQIGLTATPRETKDISNIEYFSDPIYTYTLKQGIEDGFLAPYKVLRIGINVDLEGWRPENGKTDENGNPVEDRIYNEKDFDRNLVIDERTKLVAKRITEFLGKTGRYDKTIVFCIDIEHAERMRRALCNENPEEINKNYKYVMRITGDEKEGQLELDNFTDPEQTYPVIATTSKLMTTGIDAQTCKLIVLDSNIRSMTEFKQIIGRGTRINEEYDKYFFTIMDFRNVTDLFADPDFDGPPLMIKVITGEDPIPPDEPEQPEPPLPPDIRDPLPPGLPEPPLPPGGEGPKPKVYVAGIDVSILNERIQLTDAQGKLITIGLIEYTRIGILREYRSLEDFLSNWNEYDKKTEILKELASHDILIDELKEKAGKELDMFDLICHIAWDQPALTRKERANNVKKRDYFTQYGEKAREVLSALVDKYAEEGIEAIEDMSVLRVAPLNEYGTPMEIISYFGNKDSYLKALNGLEYEIYSMGN